VRRLLALLGALAMVGSAILVRSAIDDDTKSGNDRRTPILLCAAELANVCDELAREADVKIVLESVGATTSTLATRAETENGRPQYDGWLTFERNAEIVQEARRRNSLPAILEDASPAIARTPLLLAIWKDRANVLDDHCAGEITVACIGGVAGTRWASIGGDTRWGDVKLGHADPEDTGEGLAIIGQEAAQFVGRSQLSRDDFDQDAFLEWFSTIERAVELDADAFEHLLSFGAARYDIVTTTEATATRQLARASRDRQEALRLLYPDPVASIDVVFAPFIGGDSDLADIVTGDDGTNALERAGFRVGTDPPEPRTDDPPPLPARSNLPDAGTLEALLQTWRGVTE